MPLDDELAPSLASLGQDKLRALLAAGQNLVASLEIEIVLGRLLETARELTGAQYAALGVLDRQRHSLEQFHTLGIDEEARQRIGDLPRGRGVLGALITHPRPLRLEDVSQDPRSVGFPEHHPPMNTFLGVPVTIGGEAWGNLYLTEKEGGVPFTHQDEATAIVLAGWTGVAVSNARAASAQRASAVLATADRERKRWARELHDETLQGLGAIRVTLGSALRGGDGDQLRAAVDSAAENLSTEIDGLRRLALELRPSSLDQLGLAAAIEALADQTRERYGMKVGIGIDPSLADSAARFDDRTETSLYRIVGEALTNAAKHSGADQAHVTLARDGSDHLVAEVSDDGSGFDPAGGTVGLGLIGIRERADLAGGKVDIDTAPGRGTRVRIELPAWPARYGEPAYGEGGAGSINE